MTLVSFDLHIEPERASYEEIAQLGVGGASPRGSTYWRRAQSCGFEHLLANVLHWEPSVRADALDVGLLWHGVLETYYNAVHAAQRGERREYTAEQEAFRLLQRFRDREGWLDFYDVCSRMLDAYVTRWQYADRDWEIVAVEFTCGWTRESHPEIFASLGFEETTRLDMLIVDHSLQPVTRSVEHKSARGLDPQTVVAYGQDDQLLGQAFLGRHWNDWAALGYPPYVGALVNVTTKAKSPKCERLPIQPSDAHLAAWADHKRFWQHMVDVVYPAAGYPRNYTQCTRRFGRCQFYELCRRSPELRAGDAFDADARDLLPNGYVRRESRFDMLEAL